MYRLLSIILFASAIISVKAQNVDLKDAKWTQIAYRMPAEWYATQQAVDIAEVVLSFQMDNGGWQKNIKYQKPIPQETIDNFAGEGVGSTIDNEATTSEMIYLAKVYNNVKDERYKEAFHRGLAYLLEAQYTNGGWPQFYPVRLGPEHYSACITYNDNAMINVMRLLRDICDDTEYLRPISVSGEVKERCREAFDQGVQCILSTQIVKDDRPTVWCAQHDANTLAPAKARAYELESYSGYESVDIVELLMALPNPTPSVIAAVDGAMQWFEQHKITGWRYVHYIDADGNREARLDADAEGVLWARFYDLETEEPFFCDRDGIKRSSVYEIGQERRGGYLWYTPNPERLFPQYEAWKKRLNND